MNRTELIDRGHITKHISLFFGETQIGIFSVHAEMCLLTATASGLLATCSMLAVRHHTKPCHQFVDVSAVEFCTGTVKYRGITAGKPRQW